MSDAWRTTNESLWTFRTELRELVNAPPANGVIRPPMVDLFWRQSGQCRCGGRYCRWNVANNTHRFVPQVPCCTMCTWCSYPMRSTSYVPGIGLRVAWMYVPDQIPAKLYLFGIHGATVTSFYVRSHVGGTQLLHQCFVISISSKSFVWIIHCSCSANNFGTRMLDVRHFTQILFA